jgi:carbohydrate-binding DOMON domain-containing protein
MSRAAQSKNSFSPDILKNFGINAQTDYVDVGSIVADIGNVPRKYLLLKPSRQKQDATTACQKVRGSA